MQQLYVLNMSKRTDTCIVELYYCHHVCICTEVIDAVKPPDDLTLYRAVGAITPHQIMRTLIGTLAVDG